MHVVTFVRNEVPMDRQMPSGLCYEMEPTQWQAFCDAYDAIMVGQFTQLKLAWFETMFLIFVALIVTTWGGVATVVDNLQQVEEEQDDGDDISKEPNENTRHNTSNDNSFNIHPALVIGIPLLLLCCVLCVKLAQLPATYMRQLQDLCSDFDARFPNLKFVLEESRADRQLPLGGTAQYLDSRAKHYISITVTRRRDTEAVLPPPPPPPPEERPFAPPPFHRATVRPFLVRALMTSPYSSSNRGEFYRLAFTYSQARRERQARRQT